jgi:hypothetical protein
MSSMECIVIVRVHTLLASSYIRNACTVQIKYLIRQHKVQIITKHFLTPSTKRQSCIMEKQRLIIYSIT